jgi:hypothetical protein
MDDPAPATHDLGGNSRFRCTPVEPDDDAPPDAFGKRVDAIRQILGSRGLMTVDEMRRGIEALPPEEYHSLTYYEKWLRSMVAILDEKGVLRTPAQR